jgi:hypothetical protein
VPQNTRIAITYNISIILERTHHPTPYKRTQQEHTFGTTREISGSRIQSRKMELTLGSETSTHFNQTPGLYPKENTLLSIICFFILISSQNLKLKAENKPLKRSTFICLSMHIMLQQWLKLC